MLRKEIRFLLILDVVLLAISPDFSVPVVPLKPSILYDLYTAAALLLQSLQNIDAVRVADANVLHLSGVLQSHQGLPGDDRARERLEGGVQDVAVDVVGAQVLQRILEGVVYLRLQTGRRIVGQRLRLVLPAQRCEPAKRQ